MRSSAILIFLVVAVALANCQNNKPSSLTTEAMRHMSDCAENIKVNFNTCGQMLKEDADRSDPKFDACKDIGVCLNTKLGTMVGNDWDFAKILGHKNRITDDADKKDADRVYDLCKGTALGPSQRESFMKMTACLLKNSRKFREVTARMTKSLAGSSNKQ